MIEDQFLQIGSFESWHGVCGIRGEIKEYLWGICSKRSLIKIAELEFMAFSTFKAYCAHFPVTLLEQTKFVGGCSSAR
jgi:hypothetical protein